MKPCLRAFVALLLLALCALVGCPRLPPVSGCAPLSQSCEADRPRVCSASQRWQPAGDEPCASVGGVCTVAGGLAFCAPVPVADGGAL